MLSTTEASMLTRVLPYITSTSLVMTFHPAHLPNVSPEYCVFNTTSLSPLVCCRLRRHASRKGMLCCCCTDLHSQDSEGEHGHWKAKALKCMCYPCFSSWSSSMTTATARMAAVSTPAATSTRYESTSLKISEERRTRAMVAPNPALKV